MTLQLLAHCDHAFLDQFKRLCMTGINTRLVLPRLPVTLAQCYLVGRIDGLNEGETVQLQMHLNITTPSGEEGRLDQGGSTSIEVASEYVFVVIRGMAFLEPGAYRFALRLGDQAPEAIEVPVSLQKPTATPTVH